MSSVSRLASVAFVLALGLLPLQASPPPAATTFAVDAVHSSVLFRISHMGVGAFWGRFNDVKGTIVWSDADPAARSIEVEVPVESIDSNNEKRDEHLKSPDFFNARQFPTLSFKSSSCSASGEVKGQLTLHGQTREVTFKATKLGEKDGGPRMGYRAGWEATLTIKRSEFGMSYGVEQGVLGDEVQLTIALEGLRK